MLQKILRKVKRKLGPQWQLPPVTRQAKRKADGKIKPVQVFNRHCYFSDVSEGKARPAWFSRAACHENLLATANPSLAEFHYVYDEAKGKLSGHFLGKIAGDIHVINTGQEGRAFLALLDHVLGFDFPDDTIIYIVEDDYVHQPGWCEALLDGFATLGDNVYLSLYDHADKYGEHHRGLKSELKLGKRTHWRLAPSTTNTYAMKFGLLKADVKLQRQFSVDHYFTDDYKKFAALNRRKGRKLFTAVPGISTHAETAFMAPLVDWQKIMRDTTGRSDTAEDTAVAGHPKVFS